MKYTNYNFMVLDIETSKFTNSNGEPTAVWLSYGYCKLYDRNGNTQLKCYFREWSELADFLQYVSSLLPYKKIVCYVHNLGYEFDYLIKNLSRPKQFLTNSSHSVISSELIDYPNIEFRCSVKLSAMRLSKLGESLGFAKLESDYRTITPLDSVTEEEKEYCERDCDIVAKYVAENLLKEFGTFNEIPYTKTGRVRHTYYKYYYEYAKALKEKGHDVEWDLMPSESCYNAELHAFSGGITISNPMFTGMVLKNVHSYDITSSYPYAQLREKYPYTIDQVDPPSIDMLNEPFFIAKIKFNNLKSKFNWGWLSTYKMIDYWALGSEIFNGKVIRCDWCIRYVTNVDLETIKMSYDFDSIELLEFYRCEKYGDLPEPYIKTIDIYAREKSRLKKVVSATKESDSQWLELNMQYMQVKGDFNSIYGMSVQKLVQNEYIIDDLFVWKLKDKPYKQSNKHIRRNFLFGVFVTAYARRNLIRAIVHNCPHSFVYADTDSIKFIGENKFHGTNKLVQRRYKPKPYLRNLGHFDYEGTYDEFITYGAKKYAYMKGGIVYPTVAGLPKIKIDDNDKMTIWLNGKNIPILEFKKSLNYFVPSVIFKDCKLGKKYINSDCTFELDDDREVMAIKPLDDETKEYLKENNITTGGGVALFSTSYQLDITKDDRKYIEEEHKYLKSSLEYYKIELNIDLFKSIDFERIVI